LILIFEIYRLAQEIPVFDQEHIEGVVSVSSFLVSRRLARLFIEDIPIPLIFSVTFYFMAGFRHLASQFFTFFALILLIHYLSVTLAMLCIAISRSFASASMVANLVFTVQTLCSKSFRDDIKASLLIYGNRRILRPIQPATCLPSLAQSK
jgi:hypothetical protein